LHIGIKEGETAPVDSLLAVIGEEGEDISELVKGGGSGKPKAEPKSDETDADDPKQDKAEGGSVSEAEKKETSKSGEEAKSSDDSSNNQQPSTSNLPKDVTVVTMPRLSDTMTEGTVARWLKKVGDKVSEGDILAEIETDKATMEFESFNAGTLLYIGIKEGESASIDSVLAIIGPEGTDVSGINFAQFGHSASGAENFKKGGSEAPRGASAEPETGKTEDVSEKQTETVSAADGKRIFISPLARKIAEEKGYNISQIKGTGENGRITKADVESFTPAVAQPTTETKQADATKAGADGQTQQAAVKPFVPAGETFTEEIKNNQMRKTIAKRLAESAFSAPVFYLTIEISMDNAMASRTAINAMPDTKVSFNDMVIKACAVALRKHPRVNSQWKDDVTLMHHHINIGVAVAVEDGLLVPVLRFADQMSLTQIGANVKDLASKAKNKKIQPAEMEGSTFTVSNLGMFGISEFTSIINQPNSAILSVGAIEQKPVVRDGQIVVGHTMKVTLACDHRTVDGATGAEFLQTLRQYIENPVTMLA
jgi:pyruvate dehydrogenase E2 component (dihydrolipoamide acetyltransferase)